MADIHDKLRRKVNGIFEELAGDRLRRLDGSCPAWDAMEAIQAALLSAGYSKSVAGDIGFHMADWNSDAAFIVALHLFPERFTKEETEEGMRAFVIHAPNHNAAAAKLMGHPIMDIFEVGLLSGSTDNT